MRHLNRTIIHWSLVSIEIVLFVTAVVSAYLSQINDWPRFLAISIFAVILFAVLRIATAWPDAVEFLAQDTLATRLAASAMSYGVVDYFNMQAPFDQARRNQITQEAISDAKTMWLCANSGASYLEPAVYRHWPIVEKKLNEGVEFRVVLLDPLSDEKRFRNLLNIGGELLDSKINIPNLIKQMNTFPTLDIRVAPFGMHATVFGNESLLFFDPYHVGLVANRIENRSFCLQIHSVDPADGVGLYRLFKSHFDTVWRSSKPLGNWLKDSADQLPRDIPPLQR